MFSGKGILNEQPEGELPSFREQLFHPGTLGFLGGAGLAMHRPDRYGFESPLAGLALGNLFDADTRGTAAQLGTGALGALAGRQYGSNPLDPVSAGVAGLGAGELLHSAATGGWEPAVPGDTPDAGMLLGAGAGGALASRQSEHPAAPIAGMMGGGAAGNLLHRSRREEDEDYQDRVMRQTFG